MSKDEQAIEAEIQAKGLNAPRLSPEKIDAVIAGEDYHVFPGTTLTVVLPEAAQRLHRDRRKRGSQPGELRRGAGPEDRQKQRPRQDLGARRLCAAGTPRGLMWQPA